MEGKHTLATIHRMQITGTVVNFADTSAILRTESTIDRGGEKSVWGPMEIERDLQTGREGGNRRGN